MKALNYIQVIPMTDEEKLKMYMQMDQRKLAEMHIEALKHIPRMSTFFAAKPAPPITLSEQVLPKAIDKSRAMHAFRKLKQMNGWKIDMEGQLLAWSHGVNWVIDYLSKSINNQE